MKNRKMGYSQEISASKAGISTRSGRRIETEGRSPKGQRDWRTRQDPLEAIWMPELVPLLEREPSLTGTTLWEHLDDKYPQKYPAQLLRTLQRRIKHWRATKGPPKKVIFRQSVPAGHQGLSDFTHPRTTVTIAGEVFDHLLYQFRLAYSGWRYVHIVRGGESYSALADGLQSALHKLGGAPKEHRTDHLTAAWVTQAQREYLTKAYGELCGHYSMKPTTNNLGISHENGAIETSNGSLKHRIDQAIKLRGSADFASEDEYAEFIHKITRKLNRLGLAKLTEEQKVLTPLPPHRFADYLALSVKVTSSSTISVKRTLYSVPSRLVGETLRVHLYHNRLICFLGQSKVLKRDRVYPLKGKDRARSIDYRHIIYALAAKPQAFRFSQFREDILPDEAYRHLWQKAQEQFSIQEACKWMVSILKISVQYNCKDALSKELLQHDKLPDLKKIQNRYLEHTSPPAIPLRQHSVADYDQLLEGQWHRREVICA